MDVELRHLRSLVAVVEAGTFTRAAADLRTSQASVSRSIAALERAVGAQVLRRTTRELSLTGIGVRVVAHARRVLEEIAAISRIVVDAAGEVRVGYAWAGLGRHTTVAQQRWAEAHPGSELIFVQSNTPTAGLTEGMADVAVLRRPLTDERFATAVVGIEARLAAVSSGDPLARRRRLSLADFAGRTIGLDDQTGTTTTDLWPPDAAPATVRRTHGIDEWLTLIAAGQAIGLTSEATARQHPRPGVTYRPVADAQPMAVWLAWWADSPPPRVAELVALVCGLYAAPA